MKRIIKIKPDLVDKTNFIKKIEKEVDLSVYTNILGILILIIGGFCLYRRYTDKNEINNINKMNIFKLNKHIHNYLELKDNYLENKIK